MYRPYTFCNLWRKMFTHKKIVNVEYIELCIFFEKLCTLKIQNCVHSLKNFMNIQNCASWT